MPKFFVTQDKISDNQIIIDSEDVTHISRVLRLEKGDNVTVLSLIHILTHIAIHCVACVMTVKALMKMTVTLI